MTASAKRPIQLMLPCPPPAKGRAWGDYYFGQSLASALRALGHPVDVTLRRRGKGLVQRLRDWWDTRNRAIPQDAVEFLLLGQPSDTPRTHRRRIIWLISNSDMLDHAAARQADKLFVASAPFAARLAEKGIACEVLLQCTDPALFAPDMRRDALRSDVLFVGNRTHKHLRPAVAAAARAGCAVTVWGTRWDKSGEPVTVGGTHIANAELGAHYASCEVVLNDHRQAMRDDAFVSNRVYDGLACGRPVVTEEMDGLPGDLRPGLRTYTTAADVPAAISAAKAIPRDVLAEVSARVRRDHSFARRAETISACVQSFAPA